MQGGSALKGINLALFTINTDGTGLRRLTPWGIQAAEADWSPDGTRIEQADVVKDTSTPMARTFGH